MSGGYFDYVQYRFDEPIEQMEEVLKNNEHGFTKETVDVFIDTLQLLKLAKVCLHRVDWLLSGDDGEGTFHERLKEDIEELKK